MPSIHISTHIQRRKRWVLRPPFPVDPLGEGPRRAAGGWGRRNCSPRRITAGPRGDGTVASSGASGVRNGRPGRG